MCYLDNRMFCLLIAAMCFYKHHLSLIGCCQEFLSQYMGINAAESFYAYSKCEEELLFSIEK